LEEENKVLKEKLLIAEAKNKEDLEEENKVLKEKNVELQEKLTNELAKNAIYYGQKGLQKMLFEILEKNTVKEIEDCQSKENTMKGNVKRALMKFFKE
jgi:hypothetical protein